jgi:tetratricopeptide (TPR) repeat protein
MSEKQEVKEEAKNYIKLTEDNGVKKLTINEGSGIQASLNKEVIIKYKAEYNNKVYDESTSSPYRFTTGKNEVIKGLEIAVLSMKVGEKSSFIIEPKYAYEENQISSIVPKNATINLEIELIQVLDAQKDLIEMDYPEKISRGKQLKLKGDEKFKQGDYLYAKYYYLKSITYLETLDLSDEDQEDGVNLLCATISNICNCFNKLDDNNSVIDFASRGLQIRQLPKFFYFRAIAYANKNEIDLALKDLEKLKNLLKNDKKDENDEGVKYILKLIENKQNQDIKENKKFSKSLLSHNKYEENKNK